jgi:hypothetical protein
MAKMCPKCSGGGHELDEPEKDEGLCIHEKIGITLVGTTVVVAGLLGTGAI